MACCAEQSDGMDVIMKFKKGDIVGRVSYNKDIIFVISRIIKYNGQDMAILKGLITRIEADSPLDDLELIENTRVAEILERFDKEIEKRKKNLLKSNSDGLKRNREYYGKILHLDGDTHLSNQKKHSNINTSKQVTFNHNKNNVSKIKIHYFF